jgi:integrase
MRVPVWYGFWSIGSTPDGEDGWRTAMTSVHLPTVIPPRPPWNRGRNLGQKRPLQPKHVWAIRVRLELSDNLRNLALFNLAIDSKLRGCDLVRLKVSDLIVGGVVRESVTITQGKTGHPVQFEIEDLARKEIGAWCARPEMTGSSFLFPSRFHGVPHISTRQYARMVHQWVTSIGLEPSAYGTHSMRRTKAASLPSGQSKWTCGAADTRD